MLNTLNPNMGQQMKAHSAHLPSTSSKTQSAEVAIIRNRMKADTNDIQSEKRYHFLYNLLFNLYCACEKIFPDLDENLPLGVVFCVDHESDIIFSIRDRDQG